MDASAVAAIDLRGLHPRRSAMDMAEAIAVSSTGSALWPDASRRIWIRGPTHTAARLPVGEF
jgi:hypothetical protein